MTRVKTRERRGERGQATVEFAIILPVMLLVVVGLIQFGKAFNYWINLNHIANEGARWAVVNKIPQYTCGGSSFGPFTAPTAAQYQNYLECQLSNDELKALAPTGNIVLSCTPSGTTANIGDPATVKVTTNNYKVGFGSFGFNIKLSGSSTMRLEQIPSWKQAATPCV